MHATRKPVMSNVDSNRTMDSNSLSTVIECSYRNECTLDVVGCGWMENASSRLAVGDLVAVGSLNRVSGPTGSFQTIALLIPKSEMSARLGQVGKQSKIWRTS